MTTVLEKGSITLHTKDLLRYAVDCDSLMRDIGNFITKDIVIPSTSGYLLVFYPLEKDEYSSDDCFFNIQYDRDLNFKLYQKSESNIPKDMKYIVFRF